ncbi:UNVERIFIED_ORG: type I restriction enzyme S subunit [Rhizobium sophorae]|uniref:restriction endonuclease subunit S n=1 Tax=Rhizobium leguminosarum TaxID=384 RepID=UPI00161C229D|nr:restriction endonuclease subunit S [Rhizobium leguminosarum]MBB4524237.1 type I restriction enzyme S subunit [Rhizobium leguminosarum]MDH6661315.1 type I restriction enzyme S subunit [Rhizobium sophorae]
MRTDKLGNLAEFRNGLNYTDADNGSGLAVVGVSDFKDKVVIDTDNLPQLSLSALSKPDALIQERDILFVRSNGNRELIGRSVYVNKEPAMPTSHSGFTIRCRFQDRRCHPRYYAYLFRGSIIRQTLSAQGGGTNISNLNQQILAELDVPVPDFFVQRRIADILSAYDDLIEVNQRRIGILEDMTRRLFDEWFVRFRYPGHGAVPLVATELGMVPEGWFIVRAEEIIDFDPRTKVPKEGFKRFVPMGSLDTVSSVISGWETRSGNSGSKFQSGDTLFARITPCLENGKTGLVNFLEGGEAALGSTEFTVMRGKNVSSSFVYLLARSEAFRAIAIKSMGGADGRQRVRTEALKAYEIACPPSELLTRFASVTDRLLRQVRILADQNARLRAARDLLLPKLISGEIDVSAAEETFAEAAE